MTNARPRGLRIWYTNNIESSTQKILNWRIVSQDEQLFRPVKSNELSLHERWWFDKFFWLFFCEEYLKNKVSAFFYEITVKLWKSFEYPLQKDYSGWPIAACDSKSCSESRRDPENCCENQPWMYSYSRENLPMTAKKTRIRNLMQLSEHFSN